MIVGVINGYYRSWTTIWQKSIEEANPDLITIHEPFSPIVGIELLQGHKYIHGWDVYKGYFRLSPKIRREFLKRLLTINPKGVVTDWDDVIYILDLFHNIYNPVIIKSCQLHFFLDKIEDHYGCWTIHIERELPYNIYAHVEIYPNDYFRKRVLLLPQYNDCFFVDSVHDQLCRYFNDKQRSNVLQKLIYNITKCNENANAVKVKFEKPEEIAKSIPVKVNVDVIDKNKIKPNLPKWFVWLYDGI